MHPVILKSLISLFVALPIGLLLIRLLFKKSILFKIGFLWILSTLLTAMIARIWAHFPEDLPVFLGLILQILITGVPLYIIYRMIRIPFQNIIKNIEKLADGELNLKLRDEEVNQKDELGILQKSIVHLSQQLNGITKSIITGVKSLNEIGQSLNNTSGDLAMSTNNQASSIEEISSSIEEITSSIEMNSENLQRTGTNC